MKNDTNTRFIRLNSITVLVFITFTLFLFTQRLIAQKYFTKNSPYQLVYDNENSQVYLSINFINTSSRIILNSFDLIESNPFNKLEYPELERNTMDQPNKVYRFHNVQLDKIDLKGCNLIIKENVDQNKTFSELTGWSFYQASNCGDYLIVHYLFYLNQGESLLGRSDAIFVFNKNGELINKIKGFDTNVRECAISENGKYFSYAYGSALDESLDYFSEVGYKIMDLRTNKIVDEENFHHEYNEVRTRQDGNLIRVSCFSVDNKYIFIDPTKNKKYSRIFSRDEKSLWKEITPEGIIVYKDKNRNKIEILKFDQNFTVSELNNDN